MAPIRECPTPFGVSPLALVTADDDDEEMAMRAKRQLGVGWPDIVSVGPCFTSKGQVGRCMSYRQCYPYFKLPELGTWDQWVIGTYDICNYFSPTGKQVNIPIINCILFL